MIVWVDDLYNIAPDRTEWPNPAIDDPDFWADEIPCGYCYVGY